jgi:hypothetical protein
VRAHPELVARRATMRLRFRTALNWSFWSLTASRRAGATRHGEC